MKVFNAEALKLRLWDSFCKFSHPEMLGKNQDMQIIHGIIRFGLFPPSVPLTALGFMVFYQTPSECTYNNFLTLYILFTF